MATIGRRRRRRDYESPAAKALVCMHTPRTSQIFVVWCCCCPLRCVEIDKLQSVTNIHCRDATSMVGLYTTHARGSSDFPACVCVCFFPEALARARAKLLVTGTRIRGIFTSAQAPVQRGKMARTCTNERAVIIMLGTFRWRERTALKMTTQCLAS